VPARDIAIVEEFSGGDLTLVEKVCVVESEGGSELAGELAVDDAVVGHFEGREVVVEWVVEVRVWISMQMASEYERVRTTVVRAFLPSLAVT
jgi:hypothetical protein